VTIIYLFVILFNCYDSDGVLREERLVYVTP